MTTNKETSNITSEYEHLSDKDKTLHLAQALMSFYCDIFTGWDFPAHLVPVAYGLCDDRIPQLQVHVGPGAGKSQLLSICYPTFKIGLNPNDAILGISGSEALMQKFQKTSMDIIENNQVFKDYFPGIEPDKKKGWSSESGLNVTGRSLQIPDPNYWVAGVGSATVVGAHASIIILDDIHNAENSSTEAQCKKILELYSSTIIGRAQSTGARFILAGRRWHQNDLYGALQKDSDWVTLILPAERVGQTRLWIEAIVPPDIECIFTEIGELTSTDEKGMRTYRIYYGIDQKKQGFFWPAMDTKRKEYFSVKRLTPAIAESVYQCRPGKREGGVFDGANFRYISPSPDREWIMRQGGTIFQAWDTATGETEKSDYSVCITGGLVPCNKYHHGEDPLLYGECEQHMDVYILDVWRENKKFGDLLYAVREMYGKYKPSQIVMEKKSSGTQLIQSLLKIGIPIVGVNPGNEGKRARAVNGVGTGTGSVQGWFTLGRVIFPESAEWLTVLEEELKDFTGDGSGNDDQVDAIVYLIIAAIERGSGGAIMPTDTEAVVNKAESGMSVSAMGDALGSLLDLAGGYDPFEGRCGRCKHFDKGRCKLTNRRVSQLHGCEEYEGVGSDNYGINVIY